MAKVLSIVESKQLNDLALAMQMFFNLNQTSDEIDFWVSKGAKFVVLLGVIVQKKVCTVQFLFIDHYVPYIRSLVMWFLAYNHHLDVFHWQIGSLAHTFKKMCPKFFDKPLSNPCILNCHCTCMNNH